MVISTLSLTDHNRFEDTIIPRDQLFDASKEPLDTTKAPTKAPSKAPVDAIGEGSGDSTTSPYVQDKGCAGNCTENNNDISSDSASNVGGVVAGVLVALLLVAGAAGVAFFLIRKRNQSKHEIRRKVTATVIASPTPESDDEDTVPTNDTMAETDAVVVSPPPVSRKNKPIRKRVSQENIAGSAPRVPTKENIAGSAPRVPTKKKKKKAPPPPPLSES